MLLARRTLLKGTELGPRANKRVHLLDSVPALENVISDQLRTDMHVWYLPSYVPFDSGCPWLGGCSSVNSSPATGFTKNAKGDIHILITVKLNVQGSKLANESAPKAAPTQSLIASHGHSYLALAIRLFLLRNCLQIAGGQHQAGSRHIMRRRIMLILASL